MDAADVSKLQSAVDSLNDWSIEPFVGLMAEDMRWQGVRTSWRWWHHRPS